MADALILNYNDFSTTKECAARLSKCSSIRYVLIVDNNSSDESYACLKKIESDKIVVISSDKNGGYGYGNNYGIRFLRKKFKSQYILLCNPDTIIEDSVVKELENFLLIHCEYAMAAPFTLNSKKEKYAGTAGKISSKVGYVLQQSILFSYFIKNDGYKGIENTTLPYKDVDCLVGSLFMMNAEKMIKYGMYDENIFLYGEELVLGIRLKANSQKTALLPNFTYIHNHSVSINKTFNSPYKKQNLMIKSHLYILKKYYHVGWFVYGVAKMIGCFSNIEMFGIQVYRKIRSVVKNRAL